MDPRSWTSPQLNEVACADSEGCEAMNRERLELSSGEPSIGRAALVQQQISRCPDKTKSRAASPKKKVKHKSHNKAKEDPYNPVKSPDFSIQSPSMLSLMSRKHTTPGDDRKRQAAMMEYESEGLSAPHGVDTSAPAKKQVRRFPRRNSVLIHRREGGTASMVQDLLMASVPSSPYHNAPEMQQSSKHSDAATGPLGLPISRSGDFLDQLKTSKEKSSPERGFKRHKTDE